MNHNHVPVSIKIMPWQVCRKCGLIYLKNNKTRKAIGKRCPGTPDHEKT